MKQCDKTKYASKEFAEFYLKKIKYNSFRDKVPVRVYLCPYCNTWHLTSKESKEMKHIEMLDAQIVNLKSKNEKLEKEVRRLSLKLKEKNETIVDLNRKLLIVNKSKYKELSLNKEEKK